jgi:osmotically inducible lipoprotein OsmB
VKRYMAFGLLWTTLALTAGTGCSNLTPTQQRALSGGVIGTTAGAALGAIAGNAAVGAAIGGPTGAAAGALWHDIGSTFR